MNSRKGERPKIYLEVTPLPTEVPVEESKLWFLRSNVKEFYAFIWLKLWIISWPELIESFFRLAKVLGAKTELQIDLTFSVLSIAIAEELNCFKNKLLRPPVPFVRVCVSRATTDKAALTRCQLVLPATAKAAFDAASASFNGHC